MEAEGEVMKLVILPNGWPVKLDECPSGFFVYKEQLCFKSDYGQNDIFNSAGEYFVTKDIDVQPVFYDWIEE